MHKEAYSLAVELLLPGSGRRRYLLREQRNLHDSAPYNLYVTRVRCCNRAATAVEHTRTEQENNGPRNAKNSLYKKTYRQGSTYPESVDPTYKEEVAGSIGHRLLRESADFQEKQ
jgi:hypothetical protein